MMELQAQNNLELYKKRLGKMKHIIMTVNLKNNFLV